MPIRNSPRACPNSRERRIEARAGCFRMDMTDLDRLSPDRKLLLEALLKERGGEGDDSRNRKTAAREGKHGGAEGGDPASYGVGAGKGHRPGRSFGQSLLKAARSFLDAATAVENRSPQPGTSPSPLICMRGAGSRTPFFCVHALLGSAFHYFALANLLDDEQPFYALQAPGLDGGEEPLSRIEDFASCYIRCIREVQPTGPYKVGGYSFGGLVAFEIARQLVRAGETVSHLVIFGTDVPLSVSNPAVFNLLDFFGKYARDFHRNLVMPFFSYEKRIGGSGVAPRLPIPPVLVKVAAAHCLAAASYIPRPYSGRITLLETVEQQLLAPLSLSRGWERLTAQEVETLVVSGNHLSMLDGPHLHDLAAKLDHCLSSP